VSAGRVSEESCAPPSELGGGGPKHISCRTVLPSAPMSLRSTFVGAPHERGGYSVDRSEEPRGGMFKLANALSP